MVNPLLIGLASGGAFLLSFLLFNHPKASNVRANRWLGLFVATLAASALHVFLNNLNLQARYPQVLLLIEVAEFLTAPALYLSILFFTILGRKYKRVDLWHFAPAATILLFLMKPLFTGKNVEFADELVKQGVLTMLMLAKPVQTVAYLFLSYHQLERHQRAIRQVASATEAVDLHWLKKLLAVWGVVLLAWLNLAFFGFTPLFNYTPILYLAGLYFLTHFSIRQQEVYAFSPSELKELEPVISSTHVAMTEKQKRLSDSQLVFLQEKLEQLMRREKVYLDNELSLPTLAQRVGVSAHELSYLINAAYCENFYSFVNRHRVEEAKHLLVSQQYEQLNMVGIAYQAGFNSKTTFNTAFKKWTGQSPSQYLQGLKEPKQA
ncbi:helix-turn-helix domain-containing protein [Pontibacter chinhatensis]|uniref:Transcriptional regulator, AraC family n=1 Tax=Pontibacter chinhatensis TaxID=1436961 RepID=A0A1I2S9H0_9BACT|nr:AraC family transcriptional regulator [Pontibacter chinhatensis]SFG49555.1 transcriptional regulator, AraC family [Pontibacter chinhatensis]